MSVYVGNPLPTTPYEQARRALADLSTPSGFVLGDVIARLVLDSGLVIPAPVSSGEAGTGQVDNELALCEAGNVFLRPGERYVFYVAEGCFKCAELYRPAPVVTPSAEGSES